MYMPPDAPEVTEARIAGRGCELVVPAKGTADRCLADGEREPRRLPGGDGYFYDSCLCYREAGQA